MWPIGVEARPDVTSPDYVDRLYMLSVTSDGPPIVDSTSDLGGIQLHTRTNGSGPLGLTDITEQNRTKP